MSHARSATDVLECDFLVIRSKILDLAAALDRLDRATDRDQIEADPRLEQCRLAIETLLKSASSRTEAVQLLFSDPYQDDWRKSLPVAPRLG